MDDPLRRTLSANLLWAAWRLNPIAAPSSVQVAPLLSAMTIASTRLAVAASAARCCMRTFCITAAFTFAMTSSSELNTISKTIVLTGAGKMGAAMVRRTRRYLVQRSTFKNARRAIVVTPLDGATVNGKYRFGCSSAPRGHPPLPVESRAGGVMRDGPESIYDFAAQWNVEDVEGLIRVLVGPPLGTESPWRWRWVVDSNVFISFGLDDLDWCSVAP